MSPWIKSIFTGIIMTGLVFLFYKKVFSFNKPALYNVHYVLGSIQGKNTGAMPGEIPTIIKKRINQLGYNSVIRLIKSDRLDIQVENVSDTNSLREAVTQNSKERKIEFREVYTLDELPALFSAADYASDRVFASVKREDEGIYSIFSPLAPDEIDGQNVFPSAIGSVNKKDTVILNQVLHEPSVLKVLPADLQFYFGKLTDENQIRNTPDDLRLYAIKTRGQAAIIQNDNIKNARIVNERYNGNPEIFIELDNNGTARWTRMTNDNVDRYLAIILDDIVIMTPRIYGPMLEGNIILNGRFTNEEAVTLAQQLKTGHLAVALTIMKEEISSKNTNRRANLLLILLLSFVLTSGLALLIFNSLKNR